MNYKKILHIAFGATVAPVLLVAVFFPAEAGAFSGLRRSLSDVNRDGVISRLDLDFVRSYYGVVAPVGKAALADINGDNRVNKLDSALVSNKIGQTVSGCEAADLNNNRVVDQPDVDLLASYFDQTDNSTNMLADLTGDGYINIFDLSKMGGLYGCRWTR
ncbi:MAG: dockerin type I domain-containing protein [bacterium]|nr:dockerin type I domain-containing protein [bacterium]